MIAAKKITPKNSSRPWRQWRIIQPTLSATARTTRQMPRTTKNMIFLLRPVISMATEGDCTATCGRIPAEIFSPVVSETEMRSLLGGPTTDVGPPLARGCAARGS
jgi:hypothetical protein